MSDNSKMLKEAWYSDYETCYRVKLTGLCKNVSGGPSGHVKYYQVQGWFFKRWVHSRYIQFHDKLETTITECEELLDAPDTDV